MATYNITLLDISSEMNDLRSQVTGLGEEMRMGNGGLGREKARRRSGLAETDQNECTQQSGQWRRSSQRVAAAIDEMKLSRSLP